MDPYVFISYAHQDQREVMPIIDELKRHHCKLWYDHSIRKGSDWNNEIADHLNHAACVLLFLTPNSVRSEYVKDELNFAKSHHIEIYPVYLEDFVLPGALELQLGRIQAIHMTDAEVWGDRARLCEKIRRSLPPRVFGEAPVPSGMDRHNGPPSRQPKKRELLVCVCAAVFLIAAVVGYITSPQRVIAKEAEILMMQAQGLLDNGEYAAAIDTLAQIDPAWNDYKRADGIRREAELGYVNEKLEEYETYGDYGNAIKYLNANAAIVAGSEALQEKLGYYQMLYQQFIITEAEAAYHEYGADAAIERLQSALQLLPNDNEIRDEIAKYEAARLQ